jgi:hypothetical protein
MLTGLPNVTTIKQAATVAEHFQSLACSQGDLTGAGVILFDDVRTSGTTRQA